MIEDQKNDQMIDHLVQEENPRVVLAVVVRVAIAQADARILQGTHHVIEAEAVVEVDKEDRVGTVDQDRHVIDLLHET